MSPSFFLSYQNAKKVPHCFLERVGDIDPIGVVYLSFRKGALSQDHSILASHCQTYSVKYWNVLYIPYYVCIKLLDTYCLKRSLQHTLMLYMYNSHHFPYNYCVHLKPFLFQYCGSLLGRTFCKTTVGDFICSSILPCDHAFIQPFQGTLCCACSVLVELVSLNACRAFYKLLCSGVLYIVLVLV